MAKSVYKYDNPQGYSAHHYYNNGELIESVISYRNFKVEEMTFNVNNNTMHLRREIGNFTLQPGMVTLTVDYRDSNLEIKTIRTTENEPIEIIFRTNVNINVKEWLLKCDRSIEFMDVPERRSLYYFNLDEVLPKEETERLEDIFDVYLFIGDFKPHHYLIGYGIPYYECEHSKEFMRYNHYIE